MISISLRRVLLVGGLTAAIAVPAIAAEAPNGEVIFYEKCASCHVQGTPDGRAPLVDALAKRTRHSIVVALASGTMWLQGLGLTDSEHEAVAAFLVPNDKAPKDLSAANMCTKVTPISAKYGQINWNGWGNGLGNTRHQTDTTLTAANVPKLKLKWVFGLQDEATSFGQQTVAAGRSFFGIGNGTVFALDAESGCTIWSFKADTSVRTAPNLQKVGNKYFLYFGDSAGSIYGVDAETGKFAWKAHPESFNLAKIVGAVQYADGRVYVGIDGNDDVAAGDLKYPCCTYRGSVVSLDAVTGKLIWKTWTIPEEPRFMGKKKNGADWFAPAGAGVWSSPTLDPKRNTMYVTTGDCHVAPAAATCDSVIALEMDSGKVKWVFQATKGDGFNLSCIDRYAKPGESETCQEGAPDSDFSSSAILVERPNGKRMLLAGQKSGVMHALDADTGKVLWQTRVSLYGVGGGIMWGSSADNNAVYIGSVTPLAGQAGNSLGAPGTTALDIDTGEVLWRALAPKPDCTPGPRCSVSVSAGITSIPGVVFVPSRDGHLRAYASKDGALIWDFNSKREFETVNGIKAQGGTFGSAGATIVGNSLYVGAGYRDPVGGNAIIAFEVAP